MIHNLIETAIILHVIFIKIFHMFLMTREYVTIWAQILMTKIYGQIQSKII